MCYYLDIYDILLIEYVLLLIENVLLFIEMASELPSTNNESAQASTQTTSTPTSSTPTTSISTTSTHESTMTFTPRACFTPRGSKEWIPCCPPELKPTLGMTFDCVEDFIEFYKNYARFCGFVERIGTEKKDDDGNVYLKYMYCNKQGFPGETKAKATDSKCVSSFTSQKRSINRCGCEAKAALKRRKDGKLMIYLFRESHNHLFSTPKSHHFQKNKRKVTLAHMKFMFDNSKLNIGPNKSLKLWKEHVGGYENVGATVVDFKNFSRDMKCYLRDVDATMFINNLKEKVKNSGGGFFLDYCINETRNLTRVFWSDSISRKNYSIFGDMVSFDTTYDTNTYSMVFAPFTGVDHHGKCVTFGVGLLAKEDIESFTWLFECFLKAMGGCQPVCLITDQDPAMKLAIETVFETTKHRLCMWHIMKKVPNKVGPTLCRETDFLEKLNDVVWNRDLEPSEFDTRWHEVMVEFGLEKHEWFSNMFAMRKLWIPSYFRDLFLGGILRSTQISESENHFFTQFTNANCLLVELWFRYESAIDCQRHEQDKLNASTKHSMPRTVTPLHLEKQASIVYTHNLFYKFQHEFQHAVFNCGVSKHVFLQEGVEEFEIADNTRKKTYSVTYVEDCKNCFCSCKMFESMGMLCRHILFVFKGKFFTEIPPQYILNRWTKDALKKPMNNFLGNLEGVQKDEKHKLVGDVWSKFFSCISLAEDKVDDMKVLLEKLTVIEKELESAKSTHEPQSKDKQLEVFLGSNQIEVDIFPPEKSSNKGSGTGKRKKSEQEMATEAHKKQRLCRTCGKLATHDSRNCPTKNKNVE